MPAFVQGASLVLGVACAVLVLAITAFVLGRMLAGKLEREVERWAVPAALGLAGLAHLGFLLGLAGLLAPAPVLLAAAAIHLAGLRVWRSLWKTDPRLQGGRVLLGAAAFLPFAVLALYPPAAFDATMYHLPFARGFIASGGLPFLADLRFPVFPQANEMLFAEVLLFAPDIAAHGVELLMTMLAAALVWAWAKEAFSGTAAGWLAAAVFLGNPVVVYLSGIGYVEAGLVLFVTSALYAARRWRESGERRWLVLAAVFAATAADTKYLGLFFLGAIALAVLFGRLPRPDIRSRLVSAVLFGAVAAMVLAPWYGRIYAATGNPLFPYFPRIFGSSPWAPLRFQGFLAPHAEPASVLASRAVDLVRLPWDLVFERDRYNGQPPFSPWYLAALPLAALAAWKDARQRRLLGLAAAYAFCCLGLPPDSRYLVSALPLVSLSAAGVLAALLGRFPFRSGGLAAALCVLLFLPGWLYAAYRIHRLGPLPLTPAAREAYLARSQPCYPAIAFLNRTLGSGYTVWALNAENMIYYARGRFLGDWLGPASFDRMLTDLRGPQDLHGRLRRLGAGYLLVPSRSTLRPFPEGASLRPWFEAVYSDPEARVYQLR